MSDYRKLCGWVANRRWTTAKSVDPRHMKKLNVLGLGSTEVLSRVALAYAGPRITQLEFTARGRLPSRSLRENAVARFLLGSNE
jgi:hypothetical protein